jgi:hypothetical protein
MPDVTRVVSSALLVLGVLIVFFGMSAALGFTRSGMLASVAAIGALLYVGALWLAPPSLPVRVAQPEPLIVFDREQRIVSGAGLGERVAAQFPASMHTEIERRCAAALAGTTTRFPCLRDGRAAVYDALPVRDASGTVVYGILLVTDSLPAAIAVSV